ncbi:MAG: TauD/TfdA family dioxygenase [Halobacteriovoraceae bacterium]|nr:TauD/TfdA family dioxygenase [Halobacteriovoraceae bacterium]
MEHTNKEFFKKIEIDQSVRLELRETLNINKWTPAALNFLENVKRELKDNRAVLLNLENENHDFFSYKELHQLNPLIGSYFGKLLEQNENGDQVIMVYDRDRNSSMWNGARYHQTREGGSIHTDNVNVPEKWDYLYLSCISPALVGGESILVDGIRVHNELQKNYPKALKVLENNFIWEMRGVADKLYEAPIITYDNGIPAYRHLRPYMESAHQKANTPLTNEQSYAIDVLDAITNSSEYQAHFNLKKGDILIAKDSQVLHGRACFSDDLEAISFEDYLLGKGKVLKRTMERLWIQIN